MKKLTLKQLRGDFKYLRENLSDYEIDAGGLLDMGRGLIEGTATLKDYLLWCINDIIYYAVYEENKDDIDFLTTNSRAIRILNRYNIVIDSDE